MNADQIEILGTLRSRVKLLMAALVEEKRKSARLSSELESLSLRHKEQTEKLQDAEQKYNNLKLAKVMLDGSDEGHDARIKVNRIVREIDNCIALLNR